MYERFATRWDLSKDEYLDHVAQFGNSERRGSPMDRYAAQKRRARRRRIEWQFTFRTWWAVWYESGKWSERGPSGYVMGRRGDTGPYSPSNVYICLSSENVRDSFVNLKGVRALRVGRGWKLRKGPRPYYVYWRQKLQGCFATEAEAVAVYRAVRQTHHR